MGVSSGSGWGKERRSGCKVVMTGYWEGAEDELREVCGRASLNDALSNWAQLPTSGTAVQASESTSASLCLTRSPQMRCLMEHAPSPKKTLTDRQAWRAGVRQNMTLGRKDSFPRDLRGFILERWAGVAAQWERRKWERTFFQGKSCSVLP